ncbi:RagB/SusD family nutrient uptake outer membrane protein [Chitinophaga solisilvae]|uniref:RagB/SusD family nutrient uptake outer membrane protein n=1 Tax=Chitinophaga solisilvae TaxID=1233460 RepID=UPI00136FAD98|nr:RagB/SusD family nutrient uptake outer membrane protein [Chitinophaga solisilvae]
MKRKYTKCFLLLATGSLFLSACTKLIEVQSPVNQLASGKVFADDNTAISAITDIYGRFKGDAFLTANVMLCPALSADELSDYNGSLRGYNVNNVPANDNFTKGMWTNFYKLIYESNALLEGLSASKNVSVSLRKQLYGEGLTIRAFCYFELVNFFGEVPLLLTTDVKANAVAPRNAAAAIYKQLIADLTAARDSLGDAYVSADRARINKSTATALLARVYLYTSNWKAAEEQASAVINNGMYTLNTDLSKVFLKNSTETILQLWNSLGYTQLGAQLIPVSGNLSYALTPDFMNALSDKDLRKSTWTGNVVYGGSVSYYPAKYKLRQTATGPDAEYFILFRLAEQYLIRAEARARQEKISTALDDVNTLRHRAGIDSLQVNTLSEMLNAIEQERRMELFAEWGDRWFDLKRTGRIDAVMNRAKPGNWTQHAALYPIPQVELGANPALTQNKGY